MYVLNKAEGGSHTPVFQGYRPQFYFRNTDVPGSIASIIDFERQRDGKVRTPGESARITVELNPDLPIAMEAGLRFAIRDGGRTVGSGVVREIQQDQPLITREIHEDTPLDALEPEIQEYSPPGRPEKMESGPSGKSFEMGSEPAADRHVNAWLEQGQLPLTENASVQIGVNIGAPREGTIGGGVFVEPDWGHWQQLDLVISLNGPGARVTPTSQLVTLHKQGDTPPVFFGVVPRRAGKLELYLSIYLAKEMTLLEEFVLTLPVAKALAEAVT